jgi:hypothetical protein
VAEPDPDDDERPVEGDSADPTGRPGPTTAYAVNWKTVLLVDGAMGAVVALAGLVAMVVWNFALGVFLAGLGLFYVAMVVRRGRAWQHLRQEAGL